MTSGFARVNQDNQGRKMNQLLAVLVAGLFATSAFAQAPTIPATPSSAASKTVKVDAKTDVKTDAKELKTGASADVKVTKTEADAKKTKAKASHKAAAEKGDAHAAAAKADVKVAAAPK
jgi:hypothetical protein